MHILSTLPLCTYSTYELESWKTGNLIGRTVPTWASLSRVIAS